MEYLLFLTFLSLLVLFWYDSLKHRENVIRRCREVCRDADLQLLDQTVALVSIRPGRTDRGTLCLVRQYQFEVSESGTDRTKGNIVLKNGRIDTIQITTGTGNIIFQQKNNQRLH